MDGELADAPPEILAVGEHQPNVARHLWRRELDRRLGEADDPSACRGAGLTTLPLTGCNDAARAEDANRPIANARQAPCIFPYCVMLQIFSLGTRQECPSASRSCPIVWDRSRPFWITILRVNTPAESVGNFATPRKPFANNSDRVAEAIVTPLWMPSESGPAPKTVSFDHIYDEWFGQVARWVRALGARPSDYEDVVQDVFTVAYRRLHLFDGNNVAGWLYQIARRKARDYRELVWIQHVVASDNPTSLAAAPQLGPGPLDQVETKRKSERLIRQLANLPAEQREVFTLFELEGFSGQEIAQRQQVPINTVWVRLFTARRKLKCRARLPKSIRKRAA